MTKITSRGRVGLLVKTYPKLSETFILGEILGLQHRHLSLGIYSLQAPTDEKVHLQFEQVEAPVAYLPAVRRAAWPRLLLAHLRLLLRWPLRYARTARRVALGANFLRAGWLAEQLYKDGVTHLHAHFATAPASLADIAAQLCNIPFSISAHAKDIYLADHDELRAKLARAAFTITCTEHNRAYLQQLAPPGVRVHRMYHSINASRFRRYIPSPMIRPTLLSIGRLRPKKGFDTLIRACALLAARGVDFRCEIIGYGPERERLQRLIDDAGIGDHVTLLGKLTHTEVVLRYRCASAFVLPCRIMPDGDRDGIPNVLLEAMAMQLPVVSTSVSGIPEAVSHDYNGLLVPPDDPLAVADAAQQLLENVVLRERLGWRGRQVVLEKFSDQNLDSLVGLLANGSARSEQLPAIQLSVAHE